MQRMSPSGLIGLVLVLALTVSTALLGFAHRVPSPKDEALAAYALTGLSTADICGNGPDAKASRDCPVCHLVGSGSLPEVALRAQEAELRLIAVVAAPRESRAVRPVLDPAHGLRAPPVA